MDHDIEGAEDATEGRRALEDWTELGRVSLANRKIGVPGEVSGNGEGVVWFLDSLRGGEDDGAPEKDPIAGREESGSR